MLIKLPEYRYDEECVMNLNTEIMSDESIDFKFGSPPVSSLGIVADGVVSLVPEPVGERPVLALLLRQPALHQQALICTHQINYYFIYLISFIAFPFVPILDLQICNFKRLEFMAYFETAKRGELKELETGLNSRSLDEKRLALRKVIAQMTLGKDLSPLFQSVIKCLEYQDLDIKKLVYLYIINYSRVRPNDAIMSIALFRKDAANKSNPIIRALAVRTMSSLRVPNLNEYLVEPLKAALNDGDPYVRKTAVLSIPKIYEITPTDPETLNLVSMLENLVVKESNALVLANTIASLEEIRNTSGREHIKPDSALLGRVLVAINECMEWAQVFILDFLCRYDPKSEEEAEMVVDRVLPRLSHINPSVVFGCIKLVVRYMDFMSSQELVKNLSKKVASSIVSLVSNNSFQVQYVILKNIQYIIEKRPGILENQIKCFFCKFTDPHYVKNEKIEILIRIVSNKNYESVLEEIKEYLNEVDSEFVKKCIRAVSKIAIRYEKSVDKCMGILAHQVKETRAVAAHAEHVVNQLLNSVQTVLRKYPSKYNFDDMFQDLVALFEHANEPESKEAAVWILGEYAEEIFSVSMETFKKWIENFTTEERIVQLEILSSAVKVYIKYPDDFESLISELLTIATEEIDNPDVRDRAFIYWRMLSTDPSKTKNVVFGYRPQAKDNDIMVDPTFLKEMMKSLGCTNSLYEKLPHQLFTRSVAELKGIKIEREDSMNENEEEIRTSGTSSKQEKKVETPAIVKPSITGHVEAPKPVVVQQKKAPQEENLLDLF